MTKTALEDLAQCFEMLRPRIDAALAASFQPGEGCPAKLAEAIRYALLAPGKRLRPVLVLWAAEACGADADAAMPAACAVEMVHAYSLVHDDLPAMDDDDLRRGRPTCHKVFGEAMAVLTGDALLAMAFRTLGTAPWPPETVAACCAALAEAAGPEQLVGGQADDIEGPMAEANLAQLESIHHRKTGAMIDVSLRLGALVAGADAVRLEALRQYGRRLGLVFQITDDLLDVRGEEASLGKRVGKDSAAGKLTYPGLLGVEASLARAGQLVDEARAALAPLGDAAEQLAALAQFVLERNR
ncbi:MAG: polyprenyl synthetase family protein [Pirellulales bacterium]|nr:polyprenyl synthetase family protein [Pirellulales bacterium]